MTDFVTVEQRSARLVHTQEVAGSNPARATRSRARGHNRATSLLGLPRLAPLFASRGSFSPLSCLHLTGAAMSAACSKNGGRGFRFLQRHIHAERTGAFQFVQKQADAKLGGGDTAALTASQAKEPVAILPYWARRLRAGGSSRRPVSRFTGCRRSADTASEAMSRSGWKPRALYTGAA